MSTHNIGFYDDLTKIIFELSSNTHLISSAESYSHTCNPGEKLCSDRSSSPRDGSWFSRSTTLSSPLADRLDVICAPDKTDVVITEDMLDVRPGVVPFKFQSMPNSEIQQIVLKINSVSLIAKHLQPKQEFQRKQLSTLYNTGSCVFNITSFKEIYIPI